MKKVIKNFIIFLVLFISLDYVIGLLILNGAQKYPYDNRLELLLNNKLKKDVFIIGSSKALNNIDAGLIQKTTGYSTYNFGFSGSSPVFHSFILDLIIASNQDRLPKKIIYHVGGLSSLYQIAGIEFRADVLYPYLDNLMVREKLFSLNGQNMFVGNLSKTYTNSINLHSALKYYIYGQLEPDYASTNVDSFGSNILNGRISDLKEYDLSRFNAFSEERIPEYLKALKKISSLCSENNIELVLVNAPYYSLYEEPCLLEIASLMKNKNILIPNPKDYFYAKYFYNSNHMNSEGSKKFTNEIISFMNQN
jgi:hypothetical protein